MSTFSFSRERNRRDNPAVDSRGRSCFKGLTAGVTYVMQICAVGGTTGQSEWSDPVSHMAM